MTLRYVTNQRELVMRFVMAMIPHMPRGLTGGYEALGVVDQNDELIAGLVYQLWPQSELMEITGAALPGRQWLTRTTLRLMYGYPFAQCGCQAVVMRVLADDYNLLRQLRAVGHEFYAMPRVFGRDRDGIYCLLTEETWRSNRIFQRLHRSDRSQDGIPDGAVTLSAA